MKTPGKSESDMQAVIARRPASLSCTLNLGVVDFYPAISGKEGAARHLMAKWGVSPAHTGLLCDDDNDLALAAIVAKAFLPSITAVRALLKALDTVPSFALYSFIFLVAGFHQDMLDVACIRACVLFVSRVVMLWCMQSKVPCNVPCSRPKGCFTTCIHRLC